MAKAKDGTNLRLLLGLLVIISVVTLSYLTYSPTELGSYSFVCSGIQMAPVKGKVLKKLDHSKVVEVESENGKLLVEFPDDLCISIQEDNPK